MTSNDCFDSRTETCKLIIISNFELYLFEVISLFRTFLERVTMDEIELTRGSENR